MEKGLTSTKDAGIVILKTYSALTVEDIVNGTRYIGAMTLVPSVKENGAMTATTLKRRKKNDT